jgi:hypothetical protein
MYSDIDLDNAVNAGVLTRNTVDALRRHVSSMRATPMVDEEQFRLLSGFNDIFVAIAGLLLLVGLAWVGSALHPALGAAFVAAAGWGLSEYFTRVRRMALPSIIFLLAFVGGVFAAVSTTLLGTTGYHDGDVLGAIWLAVAGAVAAGAAYFHWRRFMVPITVAAGAAAVAATASALVLAVVPDVSVIQFPLMAVSGVAIFTLAMWWDMSDRDRRTRRSDVAFWLHLLAAPLIVHPVFNQLGVLGKSGTVASAVAVLTLYVAIGFVALAIDRRALMVSALAYVLIAVGALFREFGAVGINIALTVIIIGSALLLLSAFWQSARAWAVDLLPTHLGGRLPPTGITPILQPAS